MKRTLSPSALLEDLRSGNGLAAKQFLAEGGDPNMPLDEHGLTALGACLLWIARSASMIEAAMLLGRHGAEASIEKLMPNARHQRGRQERAVP